VWAPGVSFQERSVLEPVQTSCSRPNQKDRPAVVAAPAPAAPARWPSDAVVSEDTPPLTMRLLRPALFRAAFSTSLWLVDPVLRMLRVSRFTGGTWATAGHPQGGRPPRASRPLRPSAFPWQVFGHGERQGNEGSGFHPAFEFFVQADQIGTANDFDAQSLRQPFFGIAQRAIADQHTPGAYATNSPTHFR